MTKESFEIANGIQIRSSEPILIAGPCSVESEDIVMLVANKVSQICNNTGFKYIFKSSFDKANRTSLESFRSLGYETALNILNLVRSDLKIPVLTDIHESHQAAFVSNYVDILQIPAMLCRQTDLILAAAETGLPVNIKRSTSLSPEDMQYAVLKAKSTGNNRIFLTERGTTFGYGDLIVDFRSLVTMKRYSPVVYDVTHSVQRPGGMSGASGGDRHMASHLARAAAAVGVDGFFLETHPDPDSALSDGSVMFKLDELESLLVDLRKIWGLVHG